MNSNPDLPDADDVQRYNEVTPVPSNPDECTPPAAEDPPTDE